MRKLDIFNDIVKIMKEDSASCKDKAGADPATYIVKITEDMAEKDFLFLVNSYLATFGLTGHLWLSHPSLKRLLFRVQRYQDALYVVEVSQNCSLKIGDKIVGIDGYSVKDYAEQHKEFLFDETEERQGPHWNYLLRYAGKVTYMDGTDGSAHTYEIELGSFESVIPKYECRNMGNGISFMRLEDFDEEEKIQQMYAENEELLKKSRVLIIDARNNGGGSDTAFLPLLQYCLPNGKRLDELELKNEGTGSEGMEINYSIRNCDMRLKSLEEYLKMELPEETRAILNDMRQALLDNRGKGFCRTEDEDMVIPIVGDSDVEKVYIITDSNCASSGDNFVSVFGMLPKVTVVGRPTMGILDYSNMAFESYDDYSFGYPTSRLLSLDNGNGMMRKGVQVDYYIPWSPEHLKRDVDLEKVLELLEKAK